MALIHCPECAKQVSDQSKTCINCGYPISKLNYSRKKFDWRKWRKPIAVLCIVMLTLIGAYFAIQYFFNNDSLVSGILRENNPDSSNSLKNITIGRRDNNPFTIVDLSSRSIAAITKDNMVVASGENTSQELDLEPWKDIVSLSMGERHTVGLRSDGTVVATGDERNKRLDVKNWKDVTFIAAGLNQTLGIKSDGTVYYAGDDEIAKAYIKQWRDVVALAVGGNFQHGSSNTHIVALKNDGSLYSTGNNDFDQINTDDWDKLIDIAAGHRQTVGLQMDGTVVWTGSIQGDTEEMKEWKDIQAVAAGRHHIVGLKADGTVIATGSNDEGQLDVGDWKNIVAIGAEWHTTIGVTDKGEIMVAGTNAYAHHDAALWNNISIPEKIEYTTESVPVIDEYEGDRSDFKDIAITVTDKRNQPAHPGNGYFSDKVFFEFEVANHTKHNIRGIQGYVEVKDMFGEIFLTITVDFTRETFRANRITLPESQFIKINPYLDNDIILYDTKYSDLQFEYIITDVVFQ